MDAQCVVLGSRGGITQEDSCGPLGGRKRGRLESNEELERVWQRQKCNFSIAITHGPPWLEPLYSSRFLIRWPSIC